VTADVKVVKAGVALLKGHTSRRED